MQNERTNNINELWRQLEKLHALIMLADQASRDIDYKLFDSTGGYGSGELSCIRLDLGDLRDQVEELKNGMSDLWKREISK